MENTLANRQAALWPSHTELPPEQRFAHGIADWMLRNRLTARELAMLWLMDEITDKENWSSLIFHDKTVRSWRVEAAKSTLINEKTWNWCLAELRMKSEEHRQTGSVLVLDAGSRISKSHPTSLGGKAAKVLRAAADEMRIHTQPDELFPNIINMVHPSFYPLVYGRTEVLPEDKKIILDNIWANMGHANRTLLEPHPLVEMAMEYAQRRRAAAEAADPSLPSLWNFLDGRDVLDYLPGDHGPFHGMGWGEETAAWVEEKPWRVSSNFQWLPCDVKFKNPGSRDNAVRIVSYINNLHPISNAEVYRAIEEVIAEALPEWNKVIMRIYPDPDNAKQGWNVCFGRTPPRIGLFGLLPLPSWSIAEVRLQYEELENLCRAWQFMEPIERWSKKDAIISKLRQTPKEFWENHTFSHPTAPLPPICVLLRDFVHPEPGVLFTPLEWGAGKKVGRVLVPKVFDRMPWEDDPRNPNLATFRNKIPDEEGFYVEGPRDIIDKPTQLQVDYRPSGLQVYVKIQSIELTPESPLLCEGDWSLEGTLNEHIVATSLYIFAVENVTDVRISFRQPARFCDKTLFNYDAPEVASVFSWEGKYAMNRTVNHMQVLGAVSAARTGRLLSFPNTLQYRLEPLALADPSQPGHVRLLAVCLADPHYRLVSTARVPPQDFSWWLRDAFPDAYLAARGVPLEIRDKIAAYCAPTTGQSQFMTGEEVMEFRERTAWERTRIMAEVNRLYWHNNWPDEEWLGTEDGGLSGWSDAGEYIDFNETD